MSKPDIAIRLPDKYDAATLTGILREIAYRVGALADGQISGVNNAHTAAPTGTTKTYAVGDFVRNKTPAPLGTGTNQYIIFGWVCTVAGAVGTWKECRVMTADTFV